MIYELSENRIPVDLKGERVRKVSILLILAMSWVALPASADHINGVRVTVTSLNATTLTAYFDVTGYFYFNGTPPTIATLGDDTPGIPLPAIDFGDGSSVSATPVSFVSGAAGTPQTYRASFSHTYGSAGLFTIRATNGLSGTARTINILVYGNPLTASNAPVTATGINPQKVTDTAVVDFSSVPAAPRIGLLLLAGALLAAGALLLLKK